MDRRTRHSLARHLLPAMLIIVPAAFGPIPAARASVEPAAPGAFQAVADDADKALSTIPDWQFESGDDFAYAGMAATTIGDVNGDGVSDFAVGAPYLTTNVGGQSYSAAVFIFYGGDNGPATTPSQTLYSTSGGFGTALAPAGDVNGDGYGDLLIGHPVAVGSGKAYVHLGSFYGLITTAAWQFTYDASFGSSVAPAGDVNADGKDDILIGGPDSTSFYFGGVGLAFLFMGNDSGVDADPLWYRGLGGHFGTSVAGAGDVNGDGFADIIIGAPTVSGSVPVSYVGAAYIYHGSHSGPAAGYDTVLYGPNQLGCSHGAAVAGVGDVDGDGFADVAVGSPNWDWPGAVDAGRAFIYHGSTGGVETTPIWEEWGISAGVRFGAIVQPAGDVNGDGLADVTVNAPGNIVGSGVFSRYVVVVHGARAGISVPLIKWYVTRNDGTNFGSAIGTAGDVNNDGFSDLIVGSSTYGNGQSSEGRAEIFFGGGAGPYSYFAQALSIEQDGTYFGWQTTTVGDVNGDGYSDVAVSGPGIDYNTWDDGMFFLHYGSPGGLQAGGQWIGAQASGSFAGALAPAGDVNGDGYDDILVGAPLTDSTGRAFCWYGGPSGPTAGSADWTATAGTSGAWFGASVDGAGDVNGDGFADVIIGAPYDENDQTNEGRAYLYLGSATGLAGVPVWSCEGDQDEANLGISVSGAGDVNGDRYADVVVGLDKWAVVSGMLFFPGSGRIQVYHGYDAGLGLAPATAINGWFGWMQFGSSVADAGDVDGDGYSDVLVAARYADPAFTDEGQVFVHRGSASGLSPTAHWNWRGGQALANLGAAIAGAGDVNGDGLSDIIVGANFIDRNGYQDNGEAMVFAGPLTGASGAAPLWTFAGQQGFENLGNSVGSGGDINGDGFSDILTGSPGWSGDYYYGQGRMLVFYGNGRAYPSDTLAWAVQQRRSDDSAPLGLLADVGSARAMRLKAEGVTAAGRGPSRLEWELKPHGIMFDGLNLGRGNWTMAGKSAASTPSTLDSGPIALATGTNFHWRARIASRSPYQAHTRWFSPQGNGAEEADVSTRTSVWAGVELPVRLPGVGLPVVAAPNPFNPRTSIRFEVARAGQVRVELFDLRGHLVRTLVDEARPVGPAAVIWDGLDGNGVPVASGAYHVRVDAGGQFGYVRVMLLK